jgi:excisionase family DNA binding protein
MRDPNDRRPYTVALLAERWQCSPESIYALIRKGELKAFTIGGKLWRIRADVVDLWEGGQTEMGSEHNPIEKLADDALHAARQAHTFNPSSHTHRAINAVERLVEKLKAAVGNQ